MNQEKTCEMLWDCRFCGAKKLLGKTHRHCPNCGAPQVRLVDSKGGGEQTCTFKNEAAWNAFAVETTWKGSVGALTGGIDCDSLRRQ